MVALFVDVVVVEEDVNDEYGNKQPDKISQMGAKDIHDGTRQQGVGSRICVG